MSYEYVESLNETGKVRYRTKLEAAGLEICPYRLPGDSWSNDPTKWPKLEWPEVYSYLINTPGKYTLLKMPFFTCVCMRYLDGEPPPAGLCEFVSCIEGYFSHAVSDC